MSDQTAQRTADGRKFVEQRRRLLLKKGDCGNSNNGESLGKVENDR